MAQGVFTPATPEKAKDITMGEAVIYKNYGESGEAVLGATAGGTKYEPEIKFVDTKFDGAYGKTKGLKRYETYIPKLKVNYLKLTYSNLFAGLPHTVADETDANGSYKKITFDLDYEASDVLTNISVVGQKFNGDECTTIIENAVNTGDLEIAFKTKNDVDVEMEYTGFYAHGTPTTVPVHIQDAK